MRKIFYIPGHALSINSTYYGNKNHGMTSEARDWFENVFFCLNSEAHQQAFSELREAFDPKKHCFSLGIVYYVPRAELYNKQGLLSSRTMDLSNIEKSLVDAFFLPKHFDKVKNLNIDDKYLMALQSRKVVSPDDYAGIRISITLKELNP